MQIFLEVWVDESQRQNSVCGCVRLWGYQVYNKQVFGVDNNPGATPPDRWPHAKRLGWLPHVMGHPQGPVPPRFFSVFFNKINEKYGQVLFYIKLYRILS